VAGLVVRLRSGIDQDKLPPGQERLELRQVVGDGSGYIGAGASAGEAAALAFDAEGALATQAGAIGEFERALTAVTATAGRSKARTTFVVAEAVQRIPNGFEALNENPSATLNPPRTANWPRRPRWAETRARIDSGCFGLSMRGAERSRT